MDSDKVKMLSALTFESLAQYSLQNSEEHDLSNLIQVFVQSQLDLLDNTKPKSCQLCGNNKQPILAASVWIEIHTQTGLWL